MWILIQLVVNSVVVPVRAVYSYDPFFRSLIVWNSIFLFIIFVIENWVLNSGEGDYKDTNIFDNHYSLVNIFDEFRLSYYYWVIS